MKNNSGNSQLASANG